MKNKKKTETIDYVVAKDSAMKIIVASVPPEYEGKYPWKDGEALLCLGEVANAPGHVAVANRDGKVFWCYDEDSFRKAEDDEI